MATVSRDGLYEPVELWLSSGWHEYQGLQVQWSKYWPIMDDNFILVSFTSKVRTLIPPDLGKLLHTELGVLPGVVDVLMPKIVLDHGEVIAIVDHAIAAAVA